MKGYQLLIKKLKNKFLFLLKFRIFDLAIITVLLCLSIIVVTVLYVQKINSINLPDASLPYKEIEGLLEVNSGLDSVDASASAFVVYDPSARSVLTGKNEILRFTPASTVKIMSFLVAISHYDLEEYLTVPDDIYYVEGSKMKLNPGDEVRVLDLLYGLMLPSGNDAAYTLAFYYKSGVEEFVSDMNKKAKELRLENTFFADPDGYDDNNYTTAVELARLASIAMQNETFRKIVSTRYIEVGNRSNSSIYNLENLNELLAFDNVIGVKTGFTNEAGGVLVTAVKKENTELIVVVFKSPDRFADTQDLMEFINDKVEISYPLMNR